MKAPRVFLLLVALSAVTWATVKVEEEKEEVEIVDANVAKEAEKGKEEDVDASSSAEDEDEELEAPVIETNSGRVMGVVERSTKGKTFFSYYAIPFAQPPVAELRFKDPVMVENWEGVKGDVTWPPMCPQYTMDSILIGRPKLVGEEDCLFLNIFTPKPGTDQRAQLPVMVWIHGGAFIAGGTFEYPPHALLNHDVVLVTVQYRLGTLGFLSTEDDVAPGNLGLKDQTLALKWMQNNIHHFGGNALRTTIFGESAGGGSVHLQVLSPVPVGLFQRVIAQSGSALCPWALGRDHAAVAHYTANLFNCTTDEGSDQMIACLQKVPADDLVQMPLHFNVWQMTPLVLGPRIDGFYFPNDLETLMKEGRHKRVDFMSGVTTNDGALISGPMYANEALRSALRANFLVTAPSSLLFSDDDVSPINQTVSVFDRYLGGIQLGAAQADNITKMYTDRYFAICHDLSSSLHAKNVKRYGKKTFRYEFTHRGQRSLGDLFQINIGNHWVYHTDELFYLFTGGPLWRPLETQVDLDLRDIITTMWTNFAATGNPTPDDSLGFTWDPVDVDDFRFLAIQPSPAMTEDNRKEARDFWYSLPTKQNLLLHPELVKNLVFTPKTEAETMPKETDEVDPKIMKLREFLNPGEEPVKEKTDKESQGEGRTDKDEL